MREVVAIAACAAVILAANAMGSCTENREKSWTIMFYFDGDQSKTTYSLSNKMLEDLQNLESVGSTDKVNLVVLMDLDGINDSHLYYVHPGRIEEIPLHTINSSWSGEINMGAESTFVDFITWAVKNYPAEHYNIYLNNHGGGWYGICIDEHPVNDILNLTELRQALSKIKAKIGKLQPEYL